MNIHIFGKVGRVNKVYCGIPAVATITAWTAIATITAWTAVATITAITTFARTVGKKVSISTFSSWTAWTSGTA